MTHKDIYIKFMIEYDKANVTSSYPSLTEYEVATVLDKAYNALIAQKVTGNNPRRAPFEFDLKAIEDLRPLIKEDSKLTLSAARMYSFRHTPTNLFYTYVPDKMLYFIAGAVGVDTAKLNSWMKESDDQVLDGPIDDKSKTIKMVPLQLVSHKIAEQFYATANNIPWVKNPVCYLEEDRLFIVCDPIAKFDSTSESTTFPIVITYIEKPNTFVKDIDAIKRETRIIPDKISYFDYKLPQGSTVDLLEPYYTFELDDVVAGELVTLAVSYALENVESPRLTNHLQMRGLEA